MKVYALWHGGYSYARGGARDVEVFDSQAKAVQAHSDRYSMQHSRHHFEFILREPSDWFLPAVDLSSEMHLFFENPLTDDDELHPDLYPDRIIKFGKLGGTVVERT